MEALERSKALKLQLLQAAVAVVGAVRAVAGLQEPLMVFLLFEGG